MEDRALDLFVLAGPGGEAELRATVESARQWIRPTPGRIVIVGRNGEPEWLDGRGVLGFAPGDIPILKNLPAEGRDGCFGQLLRWGLAAAAQNAAYMVLDAGAVLRGPCAVIERGRYVLRRGPTFSFPDYRMHNWLFGMYPPPGGGFVEASMVFDGDVVGEMIALIRKRYGNRPWHDAVLTILSQVPDTHFCAARTYGGYFENFHRDRMSIEAPAEIVAAPSDDPPPRLDEMPILRMSTLGVNGRFGNQLFQYAFLRLFAEDHGMETQCPPWIGNSLFGVANRFSTHPLPLWQEMDGVFPMEMERCGPRPASHELWGYFQVHTRYFRQRKAKFQGLFRPVEPIRVALENAMARLRGLGNTVVGLHLRRGDRSGGDFFPVPPQWALEWLRQIWPTLDRPVLFLASDDLANVIGDFAAFAPKTAADLGIKLNGAEYYADFYTLSHCDRLAISNSTFSFAAAMLNQRAVEMMRPSPQKQGLAEFDPWDSDVLLTSARAA